jgi:nitrous oxidase accessory protein NosD
MRVVLFLALATAALPAAALDCGSLVDRDVVLDRDLDCRGSAAALTVVRSGVRIDMAGHAIRVAPGATAIELADVHGVVVQGPGRIEGAHTGIDATRARGLVVRSLHFAHVGEGVRLTNASHAEIAGNRFHDVAGHAVVALSLPGSLSRVGGHHIAGNTVTGAEYGVLVEGPFARASRIEGNTFDDIGTFGVMAPLADDELFDNRFGAVGVAAIVD